MNTCRTCKHSHNNAGHEQMYRLGYRNCAQKPLWHFVPGVMTCNLNPIKWEQKR